MSAMIIIYSANIFSNVVSIFEYKGVFIFKNCIIPYFQNCQNVYAKEQINILTNIFFLIEPKQIAVCE